MNAEWLSYISLHHKEWVSIVKSFGADEPEDIVQDMYIKIHKYVEPCKIITDGEVNKGYIWFTLRRLYLNEVTRYKCERLMDIKLVAEETDTTQKQSFDVILDRIDNLVSNFNWYDEKLFNLYFNTELSLRDIAKETTISLSSIANSVKQYKDIVKKEVGEDYLDYINNDYEWI